MRFQTPCIPCSKKQGARIYKIVMGADAVAPAELQAEINEKIDSADPCMSPADLSLMAIRAAQRHAGTDDPFIELKRRNNELALSMLPSLRRRLDESDERLHLAGRFAACGNIIDLGVADGFDLDAALNRVIEHGFARDEFEDFATELTRMNQIGGGLFLYCCDNAGEIVFDRLFIEEIQAAFPHVKIMAVVRGAPVLNDATMTDAKETGLTDVVPVIDNGNDLLGTVVERSSAALQEAFQRADLIVSKGQANFETLSGRSEPIFFILKAKCEVIAGALGVNLYDAVMTRNR